MEEGQKFLVVFTKTEEEDEDEVEDGSNYTAQ